MTIPDKAKESLQAVNVTLRNRLLDLLENAKEKRNRGRKESIVYMKKLSEYSGINQAYLFEFKRGATIFTSWELINRLAMALEIEIVLKEKQVQSKIA